MSNSNIEDHALEDENISVQPNAPTPQPGYGIAFDEGLAQAVSEFTKDDLFKKLKSNYALQKKDRIARQCLNSAQNTEWLHYFKGMAAAVDLFFSDMENVAKEYQKANSDDDTESSDKKQKK